MTYEETKGFLLDNGFDLKHESEFFAKFFYYFEDGVFLYVDVAIDKTFITQAYLLREDIGPISSSIKFNQNCSPEEANDALIEYLTEV